jgi:hypothetical protein
MKIGILACSAIKRELDLVVENLIKTNELDASDNPISKIRFLPSSLHIHPEKMRIKIVNEINAMLKEHDIDAVFLGFGRCQSLDDIEDEFDIPLVRPAVEDCINLLLTPQLFMDELKREPGTWFMTPGWADVGAAQIVRELHLDRVQQYGRDPMQIAKRLLSSYKRCLFIDTGVGEIDYYLEQAKTFCSDFDLKLEKTFGDLEILRQSLLQTLALRV